MYRIVHGKIVSIGCAARKFHLNQFERYGQNWTKKIHGRREWKKRKEYRLELHLIIIIIRSEFPHKLSALAKCMKKLQSRDFEMNWDSVSHVTNLVKFWNKRFKCMFQHFSGCKWVSLSIMIYEVNGEEKRRNWKKNKWKLKQNKKY